MTGAPTEDRRPCLIGTAHRTWHAGTGAPEPLEMMELVGRAAAEDAAARVDPLAHVDDLSVVHCQSWTYDDPPGRLADRLGLGKAARHESILAGTSPQRLINAAAERMLAGEAEVALVVGGEALHSRREYRSAGERPPWSHPHPAPPAMPVDLAEWHLPTEMAHGLLPAWLTFGLLEQARWAARGATAEDRSRLFRTMARLNDVAQRNPSAWFRTPRSADDLAAARTDNRMVTLP